MKNLQFFIDFTDIIYTVPGGRDFKVGDGNFGVLEQYRNKKFSIHEINAISAEIIQRTPFVKNAIRMTITVMSDLGPHQKLTIVNYDYESQERGEQDVIEYAYGDWTLSLRGGQE